MTTLIQPDGSKERLTHSGDVSRLSAEGQFVAGIIASTRLMPNRENVQRKLLDALAKDLLDEGFTLNKLLKHWVAYADERENQTF